MYIDTEEVLPKISKLIGIIGNLNDFAMREGFSATIIEYGDGKGDMTREKMSIKDIEDFTEEVFRWAERYE